MHTNLPSPLSTTRWTALVWDNTPPLSGYWRVSSTPPNPPLLSRMRTLANGVVLVPIVLAKQSCQGKPIKEFFFPSLPDNVSLCPVASLHAYLEETEGLRGEETRLFVSFIRLHKAITSSSIAKWLKLILEEAGIDTSIFGAHSTCGASACQGQSNYWRYPKAANWNSELMFQRFYHKSIDKARIARSKLQTTQLI